MIAGHGVALGELLAAVDGAKESAVSRAEAGGDPDSFGALAQAARRTAVASSKPGPLPRSSLRTAAVCSGLRMATRAVFAGTVASFAAYCSHA